MRAPLVLLTLVPGFAAALCECGYTVTGPNRDEAPWLFTDQLESDFTKTLNISKDTAWRRQEFNVSAEDGRGNYAKAFLPDNVVAAPEAVSELGGGMDDKGAGLKLRVASKITDAAILGAEIDSGRQDLHWGSYRAGMKISDTNGTCASFFWYFNDTQEIDIEFLSREFDRDKGVYPINLVIQSKSSMEAGYDASNTGTYKQLGLPFDPTAGFHEYRFDYMPGHVFFYADSQLLADMTGSAIPSSPGHLILQHWSNGNPLWSGGPPEHDALLTVSYVKAYFNSSDARRQSDQARVCAEATGQDGSGSVCSIPDVIAANASSGGSFFSQMGDGKGGEGHGDSDEGSSTTKPGSDNKDEDSGTVCLVLPLDGRPMIGTTVTLLILTLVMARIV